jgi:hypothetical protein
LLLEETNIDVSDLTHKEETAVILACKHNVKIEILESLLVSHRTLWPIERVKEFLDLKDISGLRAFDYCKYKKRSDLAVVLEEFVDTTKSVLDITFTYVEGHDIKTQAKTLFASEMDTIRKLDSTKQY